MESLILALAFQEGRGNPDRFLAKIASGARYTYCSLV